MRVCDGNDTLVFDRDANVLKVSIESSQLDVRALDVIHNYAAFSNEVPEGFEAQLTYAVPAGAQSLETALANAPTGIQRFQLAQSLADLKELPTGIRIPFIHPDNIVVSAGRVSMLHFGLRNLLVPETFDHDLFLTQYKALVLHIFNPQIPYEQLIRGHVALKDATSQKIRECDSVDKIADFITTLTSQKLAEITKHSVNVPKVRYRLFKYAAIVTTVIAAVSGGFTVSAYASRIPQQEAIIAAQSDFQSNNYEQVLSDLKSYNPAKLPKSARYVLAVSAINLADLTGDQKSVVLNTISTKTDDNTLNYWAYMGRGDFEQALNLAENLGDDQLILQAYLDLYQVTKLNSQMDGSKKQQLLSDYKSKINELTKKLKSK